MPVVYIFFFIVAMSVCLFGRRVTAYIVLYTMFSGIMAVTAIAYGS